MTNTAIELPFAGGVFRFHLGEREMAYLETGMPHPLDSGQIVGRLPTPPQKLPPMRLGEVYARLLRGRYVVDGKDGGMPGGADFAVHELNALIRAALLGGGGGTQAGVEITWEEYDVGSFMTRYVYPMTLMERWDFALAVLGVRFEGAAADKPDEATAAQTGA